MERNLRVVSFLLAPTILLSSCASILNSKQQKISIITDNVSAKVYVNGDIAGEGTQVETKLNRDMKVQQLKVEQPGFKPEYKVAFQTTKSPLYIMSWIPFGILFFPPFQDGGPKSFNYKKLPISIKPSLSIAPKKEGSKYIYLKSTSFNVNKEDLVFRKYNSHQRYNKGKKESSVSKGKDDLKLDNTIFSDAIEDVLKKYGYTDTTRSVLKNKTNTIYVGAEVSNIQFSDIYHTKGAFRHNYAVGKATINWTFYDVYGQTKFQKSIVSESGEFSSDYYDASQDFIAVILEDAITASFFKVLEEDDVQKLLKEEQETSSFTPLAIHKTQPASLVKTIADAQKATVTLKNKDGHGSGIVINEDGYILTNFHVIANQEENTTVILATGDEATCSVVRVNEFADLALLKIDKKFTFSFALPSAAEYSAGMDVFAIGTPNSIELGQTLSKGIISGIRSNRDSEWIHRQM